MRVLIEENIAQRYSLDCMTLHEIGRVKNASGGVLFKYKLQELAKHDARDLVISLAEIPLVWITCAFFEVASSARTNHVVDAVRSAKGCRNNVFPM